MNVPPDVERPPEVRAPDAGAIADVAEIPVPRGHRIMCVSDLHLRPGRTDASGWAVPQLVRALDALEGPATLVLLGDVLEMWFVQPPDGSGSLEAHDDLVAAVHRFRSRSARSVVYVIGNHDARLAWDGALLETVRGRLGCVFAFSAELIPDGDGRRVRVEHGHAHDPANAFRDPRDPRESPLGMHLVEEVLPELAFVHRGVLDGVEGLANPRTFPGFLSSRYFYRRLLGVAGWIVVPLALLYLGRLAASLALVLSGNERLGLDAALGARFIGLDAAQLCVLLAVSFLAVHAARRGWREGTSPQGGVRRRTPTRGTPLATSSPGAATRGWWRPTRTIASSPRCPAASTRTPDHARGSSIASEPAFASPRSICRGCSCRGSSSSPRTTGACGCSPHAEARREHRGSSASRPPPRRADSPPIRWR